uniref:Protein nepro homolog n=1 Tax=Cacopsylla melanoneura TaxID=428564 RepID=A0A8D8RBK6_9HEMI
MASVLNVHWNSLELPQPPQSTIHLETNSGVNIQQFTESIRSLENLLQRVNLDFAGALCSRLIYKIKLKFRTTKWLQLIEKINQALRKLLHLNLSLVLKKIIELSSSTDHTLPSQSLLEWLLIKLQGFARLLTRLIVTSHRVGVMFRQCLAIGHNWHIIVVLMSLSSQIWTNCQLLLHHTFNTYRVVQQTIQSLPVQKRWTSSQLPADLAVWIAEEINTLELESVDMFRIPLPQLQAHSTHLDNLSSLDNTALGVSSTWDDLGEAISREDLFDKPSEVLDTLSKPELGEQIALQPNDSHVSSEINSASKEKVKKKKKKLKQREQDDGIDRTDETKDNTVNETCRINSNRKIKQKIKNNRAKSEDRNNTTRHALKTKTNAFPEERLKVDSIPSERVLSLKSEVFQDKSTKKVKRLKNKALMKPKISTINPTEQENGFEKPVDSAIVKKSGPSSQHSVESISSKTKHKSKRKALLFAAEDIIVNKKPKTKQCHLGYHPIVKIMEKEIRRKESAKKKEKKQKKMQSNVFNVETIN